MKHPFFEKSEKQQKAYLVKLALKVVLVNVLIFAFLFIMNATLLIFIFLWLSLQLLAPFVDVPSGVKSGHLVYYSPLLLGEREKNKTIRLHGGTLFDYHFVIDKQLSSQQKTSFVLRQFMLGLLAIMEAKDDDIELIGTSYIVNERTAARLGFNKQAKEGLQTLILFFNAANLMASASIIKGHLVMPPIYELNTYRTTVGELRKNKDFIEALVKRLEV